MKSLKSLFSIMLVAIVIALASCSKSGDPTPATPTPKQLTALDSVKNAMTGTWDFQSLTLTEVSNGKTKTLTSCDKSSMDNFYADGNWLHYTLEFNFVYAGGTSATGSNACVSASANYAITATQNSDGSVNITLDAGGTSKQVYKVKSKDITSTSIKTTLVSIGGYVATTEGYVPTITFKRS